MKKNQKLIVAVLLIVSLITALVFFGYSTGFTVQEPKELEEINVALSWTHEAQFAGLYAADQYGYFEEEGLKVNLHPYDYEDLAQELVDGKYDVVILQTDTLLLAREKDLPVKAIFADYRIIPTVYFSKKEKNILKPADLIGKTVGVAYSERYPLIAMLENAGIDVSKVNIMEREYTYDKLANDEYDVEAGWVTDGDTVQAVVGEYDVLSPYDYGVNWYADLIVVTEDTITNRPEVVEAFTKAMVRGWRRAIENPDDAALLTQRYEPGADAEHLKFVLRVSSPLIHTGDQHIGWMEKGVFEDTENMLINQGVLKERTNIDDVFTLEFLKKAYGA